MSNFDNMEILNKIKEICNGIQYSRDIPESAKKLAKENNIIIIIGGSDDLMYCYGTDCYLTDRCEHSYGWDGNDLRYISDKKLEKETGQLGLMIWWCGKILDADLEIKNYNIEESGAFSYSVNDEIKALDFKIIEDKEIYCTGKIIQLPKNFNRS